MNESSCPLVQSIEEDIALNGESFRGPILRERYAKIRAALEAADEVVRYTDARLADGMPLEYAVIDGAIQRYRAATRTEVKE